MVRVEAHRFEAGSQPLCCAPQSLVPARVISKVALDETRKIGAAVKTEGLLVLADPPVKLCADKVEILRRGATLALADALGILAAQPGLYPIGILVLADMREGLHTLFPSVARAGAAIRIGDVGEQIALKHVRGREGQAAIVHRLEDGVGVGVGIGGNFDQVNVLD
jgi:hypothetical protein